MSELRIAVIDGDWFKREHMKQSLDRSPRIAVVHASTRTHRGDVDRRGLGAHRFRDRRRL